VVDVGLVLVFEQGKTKSKRSAKSNRKVLRQERPQDDSA
jgi:hypothetical protein